jgi:hypothetical protein
MKKIVKLTESDLTRIVKRVINENYTPKSIDKKHLYKELNSFLENYYNRFVFDYMNPLYKDKATALDLEDKDATNSWNQETNMFVLDLKEVFNKLLKEFDTNNILKNDFERNK